MFFWKNKEIIKYSDFYAPMKVNPETKEVIDLAASLLTPEQLKTFEIKHNDKIMTFQDRMTNYYECMYAKHSLEKTKERIKEEIEKYKNLFEKGIDFDFNRYFIEELSILFEEEKGVWQKKMKKIFGDSYSFD